MRLTLKTPAGLLAAALPLALPLIGILHAPARAAEVPCTGDILGAVGTEDIVRALGAPAGLAGTLHGFPNPDHSQTAVLSVRSDQDFFTARQINLIPQNAAVAETLATLGRNDAVCVRGSLLPLSQDQLHIGVTELSVLEIQPDPYPELPPYEYVGPAIDDLAATGTLTARIHAATPGMLLVELADRILPLVVKDPASVPADLYRFDTVTFAYSKSPVSRSPVHLVLDETTSPALRVTDSIRARHGERVRIVGTLALFPRSPLITRDTYAIQVDQAGQPGVQTSYTLVNFENPDIFARIQDALAQAWKSDESAIVRGRNQFVNTRITVAIEGTLNMTSPSQANPQIIVDDLGTLSITGL